MLQSLLFVLFCLGLDLCWGGFVVARAMMIHLMRESVRWRLQ